MCRIVQLLSNSQDWCSARANNLTVSEAKLGLKMSFTICNVQFEATAVQWGPLFKEAWGSISFSFSLPLLVAPALGSFVPPNSATGKRKDSDFWGSYLLWLIALSTTTYTHKPATHAHIHTGFSCGDCHLSVNQKAIQIEGPADSAYTRHTVYWEIGR